MSPSIATTNTDELLPLIIGITGHRDLKPDDIGPLESAVRGVLCGMRERYPHTPLVALSPLGEGADRLVARVALEEGVQLFVPLPLPRELYETSFAGEASRSEFAALLERASAVFTLPWIDPSHETKSHEMKSRDLKTGAISGTVTAAQTEGQFAAMGAYIARYSHVFLALWDGDDTPSHERKGGTSQIVRFRLHSAPPPYGPVLSPLEREGYGAVHHIVTPRQSHSQVTLEPFSCQILPSEPSAEDFSRIDIFNADVLHFKAAMGNEAQENAAALVANAKSGDEKPTSLDPVAHSTQIPENLKPALRIYGWSDALSTYFARQTSRAVRRIFLLVFLAAVSFNLFHSLPNGNHAPKHETTAHETNTHETTTHEAISGSGEKSTSTTAKKIAAKNASNSHSASENQGSTPKESGHGEPDATAEKSGTKEVAGEESVSLWSLLPWFLWIYLGLVVLNFTLHQRTEKEEVQNKYQDYRALAEGLRVQIFWRLAGLRDDVSDHYLSKQRGELNWIRNAIKSCNVMSDSQTFEAQSKEKLVDEAERLALVVRQWVQEQRNYYVRKAHREQEELEHQEKIIGGFLMGSIGLAVILGLFLTFPALIPLPFLEQIKHAIEQPLVHALVMITIVMLAVIAGLLHGYNQQLARAEHSKRYGRMGLLFNEACAELESQLQAGHYQKMHSLLHELGREALVENGDWVLLHRERPLEVPHAG